MAFLEKRVGKGGTRWRLRWEAPDGSLLSETFDTQAEAKRKKAEIESGKAGGANMTLAALCDEFITHAEALQRNGTRERSTVEQYRQHVAHLKRDEIAKVKLHQLGTPDVQRFLDRLIGGGMSVATAKKVRTSLRRIAKFGQQRGYVVVDPVAATEIEEQRRPDFDEDGLVVIPSKAELQRLIEAADARKAKDKGKAAALVRVLLFCGLRMSELRGLPIPNVVANGANPHLKVTQRADKWQEIGRPKSEGSRRVVPLGPDTAQALRVWMLAAPKGTQRLVFPNGEGKVESYANLWNRLWAPLCGEAGLADKVVRMRKDRYSGKMKPVEVWVPRYGFHAMRHAYASINIENGVTPKKLSTLMGHASIKLTMDLYGHLWPNADADAEIASAAEGLIGVARK